MINCMNPTQPLTLQTGDALFIVDVQNDFLPAGNLPVPDGDQVVPVINRYIQIFHDHNLPALAGLPIYATRDWHPTGHCSFTGQGGTWPEHCIANTPGAEFAPGLSLPADVTVISKATRVDKEAYSGFEDTDLTQQLKDRHITRLFIAGLATDVCVLNTVKDALKAGFQVYLLEDAVRAVNIKPDDGKNALTKMEQLGAILINQKSVKT